MLKCLKNIPPIARKMTDLQEQQQKIKRDLEQEHKNLSDDLESLKRDLVRLGSVVSDDEEKRAKEYAKLEFYASMVQQSLNLCKRLITHAEYCERYIAKNEDCHSKKQAQIDSIKNDLEFIQNAKTSYSTLKKATMVIAAIAAMVATWQGWLAKIGG